MYEPIVQYYYEDLELDEDYKANLIVENLVKFNQEWFWCEFMEDRSEIPPDEVILKTIEKLGFPSTWLSAFRSVIEYNLE
tara:strand:+ start:594 stop:833 length:240 start_codon:yes stop_codon:yes gene_type:complete